MKKPLIFYFKYWTEIATFAHKIQKIVLVWNFLSIVWNSGPFFVREKKKPIRENFQKYLFSSRENKNPYVKKS